MNWIEEEHLKFYNNLAKLDPVQRSSAALDHVANLLQGNQTLDGLKAIESILTYWKLNLQRPEDEERANTLFYHLYDRMNLPEKAKMFRQKSH